MAQRHDVGRVLAVEVQQLRHAGLLQQGLVGHQKQRGVAVAQSVQTEGNSVADAPVRVPVLHGHEGEAPGGLRRLRILGDDGHAAEPVGGHGLQRMDQEGLAVHPGGQLVFTEAGRVAGGHDDAADAQLFHRDHLRGGSIPGKRKSCQEKRRYIPSRITESLFKAAGL